MTPVISVVVPVYNGEKYLGECIDSILRQDFKDFELLLLDDGSRDSSGKICDDYAARDSRIRVIHKANEGINATRRRGAAEATGEWVVFSDDDDTMTPDALSALYALHEGTDIVTAFTVLPDVRYTNPTLEECRSALISARGISPTPWAKLYRRSLLTPDVFNFPRDIHGEEDMIMNIRLFFKTTQAPRILYKVIYHFRRNLSSVSHTKRESISHEQAFYNELFKSIPTSQHSLYASEIISLKINGLFPLAYRNPHAIASDENGYITSLREEVRRFGYRPSLKEYIMLYSHKAIILKAAGFLELLRRFTKYHLSKLS